MRNGSHNIIHQNNSVFIVRSRCLVVLVGKNKRQSPTSYKPIIVLVKVACVLLIVLRHGVVFVAQRKVPPLFANSSHCLIVSVQFKDLLEGREGDRNKRLGRCWRVLLVWSGPGPALIELDKEERVFEGPPVDDSLHQVDKGHDHETDEEEGDEGPQVVPCHPEPVAQATEPTLLPGVGGVARGVRGWSAIGGLVIRV